MPAGGTLDQGGKRVREADMTIPQRAVVALDGQPPHRGRPRHGRQASQHSEQGIGLVRGQVPCRGLFPAPPRSGAPGNSRS